VNQRNLVAVPRQIGDGLGADLEELGILKSCSAEFHDKSHGRSPETGCEM
jgi:hypothetical protein